MPLDSNGGKRNRILFIPCTLDGLPRNSGSLKLRAEWICRYWPGAEVMNGSQRLSGYDLYVFQKAYLTAGVQQWIKKVATWRDQGKCNLAFDLCDPDFLEAEHRRRMLSVLPLFDFAVATTEPIARWLSQYLPVIVIPDRVDVSEIGQLGRYTPTRETPPRLVWSGYKHNVSALDVLRPVIEELDLPLEILSVSVPKSFREFWRDILQFDILLNPRPDIAPFSYKSDNKTLVAWAMGMPVARTPEELRGLCAPSARRDESEKRRREVREKWDVCYSVEQWQRIIESEGKTRENPRSVPK